MHKTLHIVTAAALIVLLLLILNPLGFWMPTMTHLLMLAGVVILFAAFAAFILGERAGDERDIAHRMLAGRAAFLAGSSVLIIGILAKSLAHTTDPWLVGALIAMVIVKVVSRAYIDRAH